MSALACYRNLVDLPACTLSATVGTVVAGYPLDNLKTRQLARSTRIGTIGTPKITVDLGSQQQLDIVALVGINATARTSGDVTIEWSNNGTSWSTATAACPTDAGAPDLPRNIIVRVRAAGVPTKMTTRYLRITPNWGTADGYREIGRLYIADSIVVPEGCDAGWTIGCSDRGVLDESAGGQFYADRKARSRVLTMPMSALETGIAYGFADDATVGPSGPSLDDLLIYAGKTGDVIVAPRAESPIWLRRTAIYGHLTEDSLRITHRSGKYYECTLTVEEEG